MKYYRPLQLVYKYGRYTLIGAGIFLSAFAVMSARTVANIAPGSADADIKVLGTSNLHDWTMEDKDVTCSARFTYAAGKTVPASLAAFTFSFPVHSLTSGKSGMDSKAYDAMKAKTGGNITFTATASTITPGTGDAFEVKSDGNLSIAGVTKAVVLTAACAVKADGSVSCTGSNTLLMSDYQIKPPTYMLGALKTGNKLTIDFSMVVKK
jgi:polyisoprenoid-binding protein YceI